MRGLKLIKRLPSGGGRSNLNKFRRNLTVRRTYSRVEGRDETPSVYEALTKKRITSPKDDLKLIKRRRRRGIESPTDQKLIKRVRKPRNEAFERPNPEDLIGYSLPEAIFRRRGTSRRCECIRASTLKRKVGGKVKNERVGLEERSMIDQVKAGGHFLGLENSFVNKFATEFSNL